ncbi:MAG TPA: N-glycosylase/DNA lyase [Candidatus Woesearchaeota archaeon]|nr:N-glycosylase/DNA lyase [Candidatus Woesearchaeota archaeon]
MKDIVARINSVRLTRTKKLIDQRMREFEALNKKTSREWFKELCFCILTANCAAHTCMQIQKNIEDGFISLTENNLAERLRNSGYRFPNIRANYIVQNRRFVNALKNKLKNLDDFEARKWLVQNIKGIGYKESSHFLRNVGYKNTAIIDFHIIDILVKTNLIPRPKTLTKTKYLEIENILKNIAIKSKLNLAELDLYLWFIETGKVLK